MAKIKATLTITLVQFFLSENELLDEVQGKGVKELEKFILNNKENIENELIGFTDSDSVEINTINVEEIADDDTTIIYI